MWVMDYKNLSKGNGIKNGCCFSSLLPSALADGWFCIRNTALATGQFG
jgi:hypothetical protein